MKIPLKSPENAGEETINIDDINKNPRYSLGGEHYKRIPAGYPSDHPNAGLLLHRGLYAGIEEKMPEELFSEKILDYCVKKYKPMIPLHKWLVSVEIGEYSL